MKKSACPTPTDEEILGYSNVPVSIAARYIGWSSPTLYYAMRGTDDKRSPVPFGFAAKTPGGAWAYSISPGALLKYKHGDLAICGMRELQQSVADGVEQILAAKLGALNQVLAAVAQA